MYFLEGKTIRFGIDRMGRCCSFYNKQTAHEYVYQPGEMWKLIYQEGQRMERPVFGAGQDFTVRRETNSITLVYEKLVSDDRELDITLELIFTMEDDRLGVTSVIKNHSDVPVIELQLTPLSGVRSLSGTPETDAIMWPVSQGKRIENPAFSDLSVEAGFRKYERHDHLHTDLDLMYPGGGSMQWYDWYNAKEGVYVGSHDATHQSICMHVERETKANVLRMGIIKYPYAEPGETWTSEPIVYAVHQGDWHAGAKIYRKWIESAGWTAPRQPAWAREFQGWLRVILKPHHCEINWDYSKIPELFDEAQAYGLNTIFLLGWERGGFARMWPDYYLADDLGGEEMLRKGIDYVHSKGGKVLMFLSYYLIDHQSDFYRKEGGDQCTIRTIWDEDMPFSETYCGEATYRKICNPPMPMFAACPSVPAWQDKMIESARYCLDLGADGVLYDIGGMKPYFCFAKNHPHKKPSWSHADKDKKYRGLREYIKSWGDDKIICMEHNVDIFAGSMDITQPGGFKPRSNLYAEMFRYTFPEIVMTNREMGQDEDHYLDNINYSFVMGLAFDMTIYRCCGTLSDIPRYAACMKEVIRLRQQYPEYLAYGTFIDTDGFQTDTDKIYARAYRTKDGTIGIAVWNWSKEPVSFTLTAENDKQVTGTLMPDTVDFYPMV